MGTLALRDATVACFDKTPPQETSADGRTRTWITRGANFVVTVSEVGEGSKLARDNADEYMVLIPPDGPAATITAGREAIEAKPDSLTIVPPGKSEIVAKAKGRIARVITSKAADLVAKSGNNAVYADGAPEVAPVIPWPDPVGGFKLRTYALAPHLKAGGDRLQPRLFRCTTMMINIFAPFTTRRETTGLSPHWHEDFEQASLTLHGTWVHHLRWPWGSNLAEWRPDRHVEMTTPSVLVIPANVVHTSRDVGDGLSSLCDIFVPPRIDFASKPGFVINEADYPLPAAADKNVTTKGTLMSWQKSSP